jgi:hypothetical protein
MEKTTICTICVCPNHCDATFIAEADVRQEWEVDAFGECIQVRDEEVDVDLDDGRRWKCTKCGHSAMEVDCFQARVDEDDLHGTLLVPEAFDGFIYWSDDKTAKVKSCPVGGIITSIPSASINGYTIFLANSAESMSEGKDGVALLDDSIPRLCLFIKGPRVECEDQISMFATA